MKLWWEVERVFASIMETVFIIVIEIHIAKYIRSELKLWRSVIEKIPYLQPNNENESISYDPSGLMSHSFFFIY